MKKTLFTSLSLNKENTKNKNIIHAFGLKTGGVSKNNFFSLNCAINSGDKEENVRRNRSLLCKELLLNESKLVLLNQIHSTKIITVNNSNKNSLETGDGLITNQENIVLGILTADCAPLIFLGSEFIAIVHVGWKGLVNGILNNVIELMFKNKEIIGNITCLIGPHLKLDSFEVKNDFEKILKKRNKKFLKFVIPREKKKLFDFTNLIKYELGILGIKKILISKYDTYKNPNLFFSNRFAKQNGKKVCGRQLSLVSIKKQ